MYTVVTLFMIKPFQFTQTINYQNAVFSNFQGVDFSSYPSEVANNRSPDAFNVISTQNDIIEKRTGFRTEWTSAQIDTAFDNEHHAIFDSHTVGNPFRYRTYPILNMYRDDNTWLIQKNGRIYYFLNNAWVRVRREGIEISVSRINQSKFKQLDVDRILLYGGGSEFILTIKFPTRVVIASFVQDIAYIPTTSITNRWTGGGVFFENINLITWRRKNSFRIDFSERLSVLTLKLDVSEIDNETITMSYTYLNTNVDYVDILNFVWAEGQVIELVTSNVFYRFTASRFTGLIQFFECQIDGTIIAPAPFPLAVLGDFITVQDNLVVTFSKGQSRFTVPNAVGVHDDSGLHTFPKSILSSAYASVSYGFNNNDDYLFVSDGKNKDYWGSLKNLYFSDLNYAILGESGKIKGYSVMEGKLISHMENETNMTSMFIREINMSQEGKVFLPSTYGIKGINAISRDGFSSLEGQSLFLSKDGIYAMLTSNLTKTQNLANRSYFVEYKMLQNPALKDAIMINNEGFLYVWVGTECYVADSRKKANQRDDFSESFQYEWYYWKGLPIIHSLHIYNGDLWMTTDSGSIMRFKKRTEINAYEDDGVPVKVRWTSPVLFMKNITERKTLKNLWTKVGMFESPSSIKIFYRVGGNEALITGQGIVLGNTFATFEDFQEFSFANIDFTNFTFNTDATPRVIVTNRTVRKFMSIQFSFENDANQPFGLIEFALKYRTNSQYKGG